MLTNFEARGYRNVDAEVELGRVNVLIGPNNSGKSNFLKALGLFSETLSAGAGGGLAQVLSRHGGPDVASVSRADRRIELRWLLQAALGYQLTGTLPRADKWSDLNLTEGVADLSTTPASGVTAVSGEFAFSGPGVPAKAVGKYPTQVLRAEHVRGEPLLKHRDRLLRDEWFAKHAAVWWDKAAGQLEQFARDFATYRCADFRPGDIASPQPSTVSTGRLGTLGSDLVHALRHIEQSADGLDAYTARLIELIPTLKRVYTADSGGTHRWIMLKTDRAWTLSQMSDGTVQAMLLAYLLFTPARMSTLCIDEPELNLHPAWLKVIGGWFQRASSCDQVVVSTHSPDLLDTFTDGFRSGEVAVLVFPGGGKPVQRVEPGHLDPLLKEGWQLGDLYRSGDPALGGWPW